MAVLTGRHDCRPVNTVAGRTFRNCDLSLRRTVRLENLGEGIRASSPQNTLHDKRGKANPKSLTDWIPNGSNGFTLYAFNRSS